MAKKTIPKSRRFWDIANKQGSGWELRLEGVIAHESWWGDEVTPQMFKKDIDQVNGDLTVWINSPGGDVFAASQIYTMLKEFEYKVTVKIDGIAASAASVVAMAGDEILMSPTAMMMCHNPLAMAFGNSQELSKCIEMLDEVKESIINAYEKKTGLSRKDISDLMDNETWFNAKKAVELGFADGMLYEETGNAHDSFLWDRVSIRNCLVAKLPKDIQSNENNSELQQQIEVPKATNTVDVNQLEKRLNLIKPKGRG